MPDEQVVEQPKQEVSPFGRNSWSEELPKVEVIQEQVKTEAAPTPPVENGAVAPAASSVETLPVEEEEILEPQEWLKRTFEIDDVEVLKAEREEYKKLKNQPTPQEIKFANEQTERVYKLLLEGKEDEVVEIYNTQRLINKAISAEVNDDTAPDIIKLGMQLKYKDLTPREIEYKYNKEFGLPKEPSQAVDETEEDFAVRKNEWQEKVSDIKMMRNIEAKLARPELEKLKSQIQLPEISKPEVKQEAPTQESLDAFKKVRENYLQRLESDYSKFEGFNTQVKNELVKDPIQVSFKVPDAEKVAIKTGLQDFDVNAWIDSRWFDKDGNSNVIQVMADKYVLQNLDKILSGVANNAANSMMEQYLKEKKQVSVGVVPQQTFDPQQTAPKPSPFRSDSWSEQAPLANS